MIESTALRYFREVTLKGSIKRAAESLNIAPSAISRQMQGLEDELATKLFERGSRGMTLTGAGQLLYRYAVESEDKLDRIRAQVEEFDTLQRGHVRIATVEGLLASFVSDFVVDLSRDYPGISITVTTAEIVNTIGHDKRFCEIAAAANAAKMPAQMSSSGRDIRSTLQYRKKCRTTNAIAMPNHRSTVMAYVEAMPQTTRTMTSIADNRNPGWNFRSAMRGNGPTFNGRHRADRL